MRVFACTILKSTGRVVLKGGRESVEKETTVLARLMNVDTLTRQDGKGQGFLVLAIIVRTRTTVAP